AHRVAGRRRLRSAARTRSRSDRPRPEARLRDAGARDQGLRRLVIGIDVGGTFTDVLALDEASGAGPFGKGPTTRHDLGQGVLDGIRTVVADLGDVATVVHGTTVGTNALIERTGAATGLITTAGFRDVLEMRRRDRPQTWGLWGRFEPVVPRDRR